MPKKKTALVLTEEQQTKLKRFDDPSYVRKRFSEIWELPTLPKAIYKKWEAILKKGIMGEKFTDEDLKEWWRIASSINPMLTHRLLLNIPQWWSSEYDATSIAEFADDIAKEYDCKTTMELSLCEVISASWYAVIRWSRQMQAMYNMEYLSNEKNGYYSMISKEIEKQSRLYMNAMMTLRALKTPFWNVSIRAKNAFIGENQQFNHNPPPEVWENP